jgi:hypothetical protein
VWQPARMPEILLSAGSKKGMNGKDANYATAHTHPNCEPPRTLGPRRRSPSPDSSNSSRTLGAATPPRLCLRRHRSPLPKPSNRRQPQAPQHGVDDGKHLTTLRALLLCAIPLAPPTDTSCSPRFPIPQQPQIILLKEGTDTSQGKGQVVSNINACTAVADTVRTTLGPCGMDKLIHDDKGGATISNDGATIMRLLDIIHPAAKILVDIAKSQDSEVSSPNSLVNNWPKSSECLASCAMCVCSVHSVRRLHSQLIYSLVCCNARIDGSFETSIKFLN